MIKKKLFEESLLRGDVISYFLDKPYEELVNDFGDEVARMVGFLQKNAHHCYDLWEHSLHTVKNIDITDLNDEEIIKLKIAAFFHDIGKPDVVAVNPRTLEQNFYNHAAWSAKIAKSILEKLGYSEDYINEICFYIEHHDDFISYKVLVKPEQKFHAFIREININTVAEVIIQNMFDFSKMGFSIYSVNNTKEENEILKRNNEIKLRFICSTLANNGKFPVFKNYKGAPIKVWIDINDIRVKINSKSYMSSFVPNLRNYQLLIELCRADMKSQSEKVILNGEVIATREEKLNNYDKIKEIINDSYNHVINSSTS